MARHDEHILGISLQRNLRRAVLALSTMAVIAGLVAGTSAMAQATTPKSAQDAPPPSPSPGDNIRYGYVIHQSIDLGGHIATYSGSDAMYATLVNFHSGPRILDQSMEMIAVDRAKALILDHLSSNSFGYGGIPTTSFPERFQGSHLRLPFKFPPQSSVL